MDACAWYTNYEGKIFYLDKRLFGEAPTPSILFPKRRDGTGPNTIYETFPDYNHMLKINITISYFKVKLIMEALYLYCL